MKRDEPREFEPFETMRDQGVLWAINRYLFHPRGYALALMVEEDGTVSGWSIQGDGSEVWTFTSEDDDRLFAAFEAFLASLTPEVKP